MIAAVPEAHTPPAARDDVRLLAVEGARLAHHAFADLPALLAPGDVVVVNTSATLPAALRSEEVDVHLSTPVPHDRAGRWVVELRREGRRARGRHGARLPLPGGATATLVARYLGTRLWVADLELPVELPAYLAEHGEPIRYAHTTGAPPLSAYQTIFATQPGSAEMPSAGRPFTHELVTRLVAGGIDVAPIVLHTGVSSLEAGESPYPERYAVPATTAARVDLARATGGRVIAVGTTVVRALETVARDDGTVRAAEGWTDLVITPERGVRAVDGLVTGFHDPDASHLRLLEAFTGRDRLDRAYAVAAGHGYRRHEFGDVALLLRDR